MHKLPLKNIIVIMGNSSDWDKERTAGRTCDCQGRGVTCQLGFPFSIFLTFHDNQDEAFCNPFVEHPSPCKAVWSRLSSCGLSAEKMPSAVDYAVKIRVNPQQTGIDLNVKHSMVGSEESSHAGFGTENHPTEPF